MTERPFRFGIIAGYAPDLDSFTGLAKRAEELGFDTLLSPDPLGQHDPLTALAAVGAVTTRLRFGTFVLAISYRDAKSLSWQAQTLNRLSGGRFELGLGLGRPDAEGRAAELGREFGSAGQRLDWLTDTVGELNKQADRPKLLLAGAGPKLLDLAAREADIVTLTWRPQTTEAQADAAIGRFREVAAERINEIELNLNLIAVGDGAAPGVEKFIGMSTAELAAAGAVTVLPGVPKACAQTLLRWREQWGISYVTVNASFMEPFASIIAELRDK